MKSSSIVLLIVAVLSALFGAHLAYEYESYVILGSETFEPVEGSLKINIYGPNNTSGTFRLADRVVLKPNAVFKQELDINFRMKQIKKVSFYFTLTHPLSLKDRFKKIYLAGINLTSSEPDFKINLKSFKLPNEHHPLKHKETQFLVLMYEL